jgi:type II secretory pathway pseudopilin PulG
MRPRGFTYLAVLFLVAIMGAVLAATATVWHTLAQRDKERELLYVGHEFRSAIGLYYERTPGAAKQFPKKLDDLLEDKRQTTLARYLRKRYIDPLTASKEWGLVPGPGETIMGVYSLARAVPVKTGNFDEVDKNFAGASSYQEWKFVYAPKIATPPNPPPGAIAIPPIPAPPIAPGAPPGIPASLPPPIAP